ncbi:hypothetical protein G6F22_021321 [Rhizopus arrhizus]|nr:hypothetical protein G6F22_021321 [Rhizopus arrhizus]
MPISSPALARRAYAQRRCRVTWRACSSTTPYAPGRSPGWAWAAASGMLGRPTTRPIRSRSAGTPWLMRWSDMTWVS